MIVRRLDPPGHPQQPWDDEGEGQGGVNPSFRTTNWDVSTVLRTTPAHVRSLQGNVSHPKVKHKRWNAAVGEEQTQRELHILTDAFFDAIRGSFSDKDDCLQSPLTTTPVIMTLPFVVPPTLSKAGCRLGMAFKE